MCGIVLNAGKLFLCYKLYYKKILFKGSMKDFFTCECVHPSQTMSHILKHYPIHEFNKPMTFTMSQMQL